MPDAVLLVARLLLAAVFAVAGAAKLADRDGTRRAVADFGVPPRLAAPLALLLAPAELLVAVALLPPSTAAPAAMGALALLGLFAVGIAISLARGRAPECHCFGALHAGPVGWPALARNGLLAMVAGVVIWGGGADAGPSAIGWVASLSTAQAAGLVLGLTVLGVLIAQSWALVNVLRQNGRLMMRVEALEWRLGAGGSPIASSTGLPVGTSAPEFELPDLHGETATLASLRADGKPVLLLFTDPGCGPCTALLPDVRRWQKQHAASLHISLVSRRSIQENRAKSTEQGLRGVLLQDDWEVSGRYGVEATPSAVLIRADGTIGSPVVEGVDGVSALVAHALVEQAPRRGPANDAAPATVQGSVVVELAPRMELG